MHLRMAVALAALACLFAVPVALANGDDDDDDRRPVASAKGDVDWTIPLPNAFEVEIVNELDFKARKRADGSVSGRIHYEQTVEGETFVFDIDVTCLVLYDDGTRAKLGGLVTRSNSPNQPPGRYGWFQTFDLGQGNNAPPDRSSLLGFGNEAENEAFCNSPNLPRFGPWDVEGNVRVRD